MRFAVGLFLLSASMKAGVLKGVVLESQSGYPLARASIEALAWDGSAWSKAYSARADRSGSFVIQRVEAGDYIVVARHPFYVESAYGQRRPGGAGRPVRIAADGDFYAEFRLRHLGAITGRVLDQNSIGLPKVPVFAYTEALPHRIAGRGESDDRGVFRIPFLIPGRYLVRSGGVALEDGLKLGPTYAYSVSDARDSQPQAVRLDEETPVGDLLPREGFLSKVSGGVSGCEGIADVTLAGDTGRHSAKAGCTGGFEFRDLSPGQYELRITGTMGPDPVDAVVRTYIGADRNLGTISLRPLTRIMVDYLMQGSQMPRTFQRQLRARRTDPAGAGEILTLEGPVFGLSSGQWEVTADLPPTHYQQAIHAARSPSHRPHPDWYAVEVHGSSVHRLRVDIGDDPARISGLVTLRGSPAAAAPVHLWPDDEDTRRRLNGPRRTIADPYGNYSFTGLPPGVYRLVASFDYSEVDENVVAEARASVERLAGNEAKTVNLSLYEAP